eukprot:6470349-Amphidinium_carterae.2
MARFFSFTLTEESLAQLTVCTSLSMIPRTEPKAAKYLAVQWIFFFLGKFRKANAQRSRKVDSLSSALPCSEYSTLAICR